MEKSNRQSFAKGALILLIANLTVKVIGAVFKIPLTNLIGKTGMGYFSSAYNIYGALFVIATAGFPVAISKMIAEHHAKDDTAAIKKIYRIAFRLLASLGLVMSVVLYFGADFCASLLLKNPLSAPAIRALSPALLFVSFMSVYRGYFQGLSNMIPTAISEVIESLGKLFIGLGLSFYFLKILNISIEIVSAGAVFGVTAGSIMASFFLAISHKFKIKNEPRPVVPSTKSSRSLLKQLIMTAFPITLGACVFSLTNLIDLAMVMRNLQNLEGVDAKIANDLYGVYQGWAIPLFNMPPTLVVSLSVSIVPAVAGACTVKNIEKERLYIMSAVRLALLLILPCAGVLFSMSNDILSFLYKEVPPEAPVLLEILAPAVIWVSLVSLSTAILQATGNVTTPVYHMLIGGVIKAVFNYILVSRIGINGAPISTNICYLTILFLNFYSLIKITGVKFQVFRSIIKPVLCALIMCAAIIFIPKLVPQLFSLGRISTILKLALAALTYLVCVLILKILRPEDMEMVPFGKKIGKFMQNNKLF